ncbi:cyclic GMP-AMP synthase-like receptor isoform X2 [Cylas formicarius]|uniref:cyclic GMP-AMP synthase-like receptor isoform X2 n=1 Tax=Cylas formicarius TaxID=197179 RepID=UPI0029586270|nr:cyclic GMP-AMP synthase-like receptor isoform X2 [Cylas formicarius]
MYKELQGVLDKVVNFISIDENEARQNNKLLLDTIKIKIIPNMRDLDLRFNKLYNDCTWTGSYYENLKTVRADEYDINVVMLVPKCETCARKCCDCIKIEASDRPGFVRFRLSPGCCSEMDKFVDPEGYVLPSKIRNWQKGLIRKAVNQMANGNVTLQDSGPAITVIVGGIYIDLVPTFEFDKIYWPIGFRDKPGSFGIVPKPPRDRQDTQTSRYWRATFPKQEREMINGLQRLKPALRLLKKTRDTQGHSLIKSYFLKTMVLWEVERNATQFEENIGSVFMKLLELYKDCLKKKQIKNFWNERHNLLDGISDECLNNFHGRVIKIISKINCNYLQDPYIVAKYILTEDEYAQLRQHNGRATQDQNQQLYIGGLATMATVWRLYKEHRRQQ